MPESMKQNAVEAFMLLAIPGGADLRSDMSNSHPSKSRAPANTAMAAADRSAFLSKATSSHQIVEVSRRPVVADD
jgi:hypothetical protein